MHRIRYEDEDIKTFITKAKQRIFVVIEFSIVIPYAALLINLCNNFPSLFPFCSVLNSVYGFSHRY